MKDFFEAIGEPLENGADHTTGKRAGAGSTHAQHKPRSPAPGNGHQEPPGNSWLMVDMLMQNWGWLAPGALLGAGLFFLLGWYAVKPKYTAAAQLLRFETATDYFKPATVSAGTFADLIRAPDLLQRVGAHAAPPISPEALIKRIKIDADRSSDVINIQLVDRDPVQAVELLNFYLQEAVQFTKEMQADEAAKLSNNYLKQQVEQMDKDIATLYKKFRASPEVTNKLAEIGGELNALNRNLNAAPGTSLVAAKQTERLQIALGELNDLMLKYTDIHPAVEAKRDQIKALEKEIAAAPTNTSVAAVTMGAPPPVVRATEPGFNPEQDLIRTKLLSLEEGRVQLANRQREAAMFAVNPPGLISVFSPATAKAVEFNMRGVKIAGLTIFGGLFGFFGSVGFILLLEFADNRLKTVQDVKRVTGLHVLTSLGNIDKMAAPARAQWAFRTWTLLQGRLSPSANHGLVCGFTSSAAGEGRTTWIKLLGEAASLTGFRVLTIATLPSPTVEPNGENSPSSSPLNGKNNSAPPPNSSALTTNVLTSPVLITAQLMGSESPPVVHIPLPGWVWNLERRKQWSEALDHWRTIDNLVILVELPPACIAESVLLGSNLPNLLWLTDSGVAQAAETRAQLDTLRHARCNLVGAVLNHEPAASVKNRFPRWMSCLVWLAVLSLN